MKILAADFGYGDDKIVYGTENEIIQIFKESATIGVTKKHDLVQDKRISTYEGSHFYVGKDALSLESSAIVDITTYSHLEYYIPLRLHHICSLIGETPDIIVTGLSIAQMGNAQFFKEKMSKYTVNNIMYENKNIFVLPQGAGCKIALDTFGENFPEETKKFNDKSYIGIDIGFGTNDYFQVLNGVASPNLFKGEEHQGVVKIALIVKQHIKNDFGDDITLREAKEIIDLGYYKKRGEKKDMTPLLSKIKYEYLNELNDQVERNYGKILDKMDNMYLLGGGSYIFRDMEDSFIKVPKQKNEFYNAIGFYQYAKNKILNGEIK